MDAGQGLFPSPLQTTGNFQTKRFPHHLSVILLTFLRTAFPPGTSMGNNTRLLPLLH